MVMWSFSFFSYSLFFFFGSFMTQLTDPPSSSLLSVLSPTTTTTTTTTTVHTHVYSQGAPFAYHHVIEQAPCLVGANGGWAADYIGRVENFDEDLVEIVKEVEKRRQQHAPDAPAVSIPEDKTPNANGVGCIEEPGEGRLVAKEQYCQTEEYFIEKLYPNCFRKLAHYYQQDVALLGFSTCSAV